MMAPEEIVDRVSPAQVRKTIDKHLKELDVSFEGLREQAERGEFQSRKARALWLAIEHFAQTT